jgi:hypothetical protein
MDHFLNLSELLLGQKGLDSEVAKTYRQLIERVYGLNLLDELLEAASKCGHGGSALANLKRAMDDDSSQRLHFLAKQIVKLWLFSQYNDPEQGGRLANAGRYGRSLFWASVKAYPPSLSPGPHAYWTKHP